MVFGRKKDEAGESAPSAPADHYKTSPQLFVIYPNSAVRTELESPLKSALSKLTSSEIISHDSGSAQGLDLRMALGVLALHLPSAELSTVLDQVITLRKSRADGTPFLLIVAKLDQLTELGSWLYSRATSDALEGVRLIVEDSPSRIAEHLSDKIVPILGPNIIKMPISPEIQNSGFRYLFAISPELRNLVMLMKEYAENGITRLYFLGGPGTGKSTVAYYYYICRNKGNFVQVNLTSESTGDKAAMKSLICGHVSGAFPGAMTREGALSFARDGVCFLDESHGVTGVVMQVLMEVLDSGQYLPFGATAKRALECAVIFASNRSWESLREMIHLDEHARLGATLIKIPDLVRRKEDLIAVLTTTLSKFKTQCTSWHPPLGLSAEAWEAVENCQWRGNVRTLMRVLETACVSFATEKSGEKVLGKKHIEEGLNLWEPSDHADLAMFVSYR